jgi:hypothetical protein
MYSNIFNLIVTAIFLCGGALMEAMLYRGSGMICGIGFFFMALAIFPILDMIEHNRKKPIGDIENDT